MAVGVPSSLNFLVVGGGLGGALLALHLAEAGAQVELAGGPMSAGATGWSYGGVPWWGVGSDDLGQLLATAPSHWHALQDRCGDLGVNSCNLWLHWSELDSSAAVEAARAALDALPQQPRLEHFSAEDLWSAEPLCQGAALGGAIQMPYLRVDPDGFQRGIDQALQRLGVTRLPPLDAESLSQRLEHVDAAVLCAGALSAPLLQQLDLPRPSVLRFSWAGILQLEHLELTSNTIIMPLLGQRRQRQLADAGQALVLDPGICPGPGGGILIGQTSWFDQSLEHSPEPQAEQQRLMAAGQGLLPQLPSAACSAARLHQRPVAYTTDLLPLMGPLPECSKLHLFTGFSVAFVQAPVLAPLMAQALLTGDWKPLSCFGLLNR